MRPSSPPVHPAAAQAQAAFNADLVQEVSRAIAENDVVIVGVAGLQPDKKARKLLESKGIPFKYLQYGSYFSGWRRRLALKIWVGWPTFPHVFVKGTFVGGGSELAKLVESGELNQLLAK
jgi:monothiol glutaredoxin